MADPAKLLRSASRLYGDDMDRLWGEFLPVPQDNLRSSVAVSGSRRPTGSSRWPTHLVTPRITSASRPVQRGGVRRDTAGIRTSADLFVLPPTPPPDIDIDAWRRAWR